MSQVEYQKFDDGKRFGVSIIPMCAGFSDDGDFGIGTSVTSTYFMSAEAREYFIRSDAESRRAADAIRELDYLRQRIRGAVDAIRETCAGRN